MADTVLVTRHEIERLITDLESVTRRLRDILQRPEPRPVERDDKGWPLLGCLGDGKCTNPNCPRHGMGDVHDPRD